MRQFEGYQVKEHIVNLLMMIQNTEGIEKVAPVESRQAGLTAVLN